MMKHVKTLMFKAESKIREFFSKENGEVNIVAIVVLIGIAVLLAVIFKDAIGGLLKKLFGMIDTNATDAINSPPAN